MSILEQFQTEAALQDRLDKLAKSELRSRIGTLEHSAITDAIRHTGAALTRLQVELYGVDDPDEMESTVAANTSEWGWAAAEDDERGRTAGALGRPLMPATELIFCIAVFAMVLVGLLAMADFS